MNLGVIKEPRGFIKFLQFIFVIAAFGTITDYKNEIQIKVECPSTSIKTNTTTSPPPTTTTSPPTTTTKTTTSPPPTTTTTTLQSTTKTTTLPTNNGAKINERSKNSKYDVKLIRLDDHKNTGTQEDEKKSYTFRGTIRYNYKLDEVDMGSLDCGGDTSPDKMRLDGHFKSESEFFVFTGVTAMLYSIFAIVVYIVLDQSYLNIGVYSVCDLVVHAIFVLFWFAGSSAWANAVVRMKDYTSHSSIIAKNPWLSSYSFQRSLDSFAPLDMSIVLGFLNTFMYAGNIWFIFKETPFFSSNTPYPPVQ